LAAQSTASLVNTGQTRTLAIVLAVLLAGLFATTLSNNQQDISAGGMLFPGLKAQINDISQVSVSRAGESVTMNNNSGRWILVESQNYPVDTGKLRKLILSLADAKKIEEKTSNAELYDRLAVGDAGPDSQSTEIRFGSADSQKSIIIGNLAQANYRYARVPGEAESWLIDQNPTLPSDARGWLLPEIINVDFTEVQSVTITHDDGETIRIDKEDAAVTDYTVSDIPEGRELSYPSVVDGMAGVLSNLNLKDVAVATEKQKGDSAATTVFTTFDGLEITIQSSQRDENTWITVLVDHSDANSDDASEIEDRVGGWEYQIQSYKADQLRRRWDDILKAGE
jgi:hypothetical protein